MNHSWPEARPWTEEDRENARQYARDKGIGFHNRSVLDAKNRKKKDARAKAKKQKQSRKKNR